MQHVEIYRKKDRYAGWPANYGMWTWGDEIVLGFTAGYPSLEGGFHYRDRSRPFETLQARSLDGGLTWDVRPFPGRTPGGRGLSADEHMEAGLGVGELFDTDEGPKDCPGGIDFTHPNFTIMCARSGLRVGAKSWFYVSYDKCNSWEGPYKLPMFDQLGVSARTAHLVDGSQRCTLFLTSTKPNGKEGRVFCARTEDGGKSFDFVSWVGQENPEGHEIMPSCVRLPDSRILVALRCRNDARGTPDDQNWIDLYASDDNCATWQYMGRPIPSVGVGGNPPAMLQLQDGRLCITYGYRDAPHSICARLSDDNGATWGDEIVLRTNGGNHDIGYTRTIQRPDGDVVTAYYFNDTADGERYIAATIWKP